MERTGVARRIPSAILDGLFLGIITTIVVVAYVLIGGSKLFLQVQDALGVPISVSSVASEEVWQRYEERAQEMAAEMELRFESEFTQEQADFMGEVVAGAMADYFLPKTFTLDHFLSLDEARMNEIIDTAFDAILAEDRDDIDPDTINAMRADTKAIVQEFALGRIVPAAINFVIWLALVPIVVTMVYGLSEGIWGRTLGKVATGIAIRKDDGERAFASALMVRFAVKYSPMLLMVAGLAARSEALLNVSGVLWVVVAVGSLAMVGPERRAMHDYLAGTAVFRVRRGDDW